MKKLFSVQNTILLVALVVLVLLSLYPLLFLLKKVLFSGPDDSFTWSSFQTIFANESTYKAILNTLWISTLSAISSALLAVPLSWLLTRTDLPLTKSLRSFFCLPYAIPPFVGAIAWIVLANPSTGLLNSVFGKGFFNVYTATGLIWVMTSFFYTFVLLSLLAALDRMDPSLEEAARLSGASPLKVFTQITLPIIRPSLISGLLLVLMASAASFGVPAMIGNPARIYFVTTQIYTYQKMGTMSGILQSGALSVILLVLGLGVLILNQRILKSQSYKTVSGKSARPSLIALGIWRLPLTVFLLALFFVLFALPILAIFLSAISKVQGVIAFDNFTFQNFLRIFTEMDETPRALMNSLKLGLGAATIATFFGFLLAYFQKKTKLKGRNLIDIVVSLPYATPGTVVALAFILTFGSNFFGFNIALYNTLFLMGLCYVTKDLNFALRTCGDGLGQIDDTLAEAARVSGASWWTSMRTIWLPLMKPALVASWFLVFMPCFSELTMTILLTGPGLETLGTLLFQLQEYGESFGGGASVLSIFIVVFVATINYLVKWFSQGKYGL
jgi:iron(III) transport system permease protein